MAQTFRSTDEKETFQAYSYSSLVYAHIEISIHLWNAD